MLLYGSTFKIKHLNSTLFYLIKKANKYDKKYLNDKEKCFKIKRKKICLNRLLLSCFL